MTKGLTTVTIRMVPDPRIGVAPPTWQRQWLGGLPTFLRRNCTDLGRCLEETCVQVMISSSFERAGVVTSFF